jgi:hypothetical protein
METNSAFKISGIVYFCISKHLNATGVDSEINGWENNSLHARKQRILLQSYVHRIYLAPKNTAVILNLD